MTNGNPSGMAALTITHHPHPILPAADRRVAAHAWRAGQSVREVLLAHGVDAHQEIVVSLNDRLLCVEEWDALSPAAGDLINVQVAVSGGDDGGSDVVKIVLQIVVAIYAPDLSAWIGGVQGTFGMSAEVFMNVATAAINVAGSMLINAIFTPSGQSLSNASNDSAGAASPTYSLSGGSNTLRPYEPMPIVMGVHRIFPDYGAKPFTQFQGDDQYLYQIFNFGLSSLQLSDFKIGNTDVTDFADVAFTWPDGNGQLAGYPGNVDTAQGGEIKRGAGWVTRTTSVNTVALAVDIEGMCYYAGDAGLINCTAQIEAWYAVSGTDAWQPLGADGVRIYGQSYWSLGYWQTNYDEWGNGSPSGIWVQQSYGSTTYTEHAEGETVTITPSYANGWTGGSFFWRWRPYSEILSGGRYEWRNGSYAYSGGIDGAALLEPAPPQPYSVVDIPTLDIAHGASQKPQRRTLYKAVSKGQYDVRVRLNSATAPEGNNRGAVQYAFGALRSYQEDTATYVGQMRLGMKIKASGQLNGMVQQLSALAKARCAYWDGSAWVWGITSNPAWWYLDFARGRKDAAGNLKYGVGLADAQIDIDGIKAWAIFCDAQGLGFNAVIDSQQSCASVLSMIARCGLGSTSWGSGKLGVVWDKPNASPVMAFGMSNIARGSFTVDYLTDNLADEIVVNYVDASRDWQQQQVRVLTPGTTTPQRTTTLELMGCTNAAQAGKFANALAAQQYYRRRTITWETDFEGFVCQRGDVCLMSHDLTQWGYSGRIVSVVGDVVTLDRTVPRSAVDYLMIRQPDGTLTTYAAVGAGGDSDTLTLTSTPSLQAGQDAINHIWMFSPLPTPGKRVKIISVQPVSTSRVRLVATDEDPAFYSAWAGTWLQAGNNTLLKDQTPAVTRIDINETLAMLNIGKVGSRVTASIVTSSPYDKIALRWRVAGKSWTSVEIYNSPLVIETEDTGKLDIEARAFYGALIGPPCVTSAILRGKLLPPADVQNFGMAVSGGMAYLTMTPSTDIDVQIGGYLKIRHSAATSGATWNTSADMVQIAAPVGNISVPLMAGTYLAKWVDSSGIESINPALVVTTVTPSLMALNVVGSVTDDGASWPGTTSHMTYDPSLGGIKLDSAGDIDSQVDLIDIWPAVDTLGGMVAEGYYQLADTLDLGRVVTSRLSSSITFRPFNATNLIDSRDLVDGWPDVDDDGDPVDMRLNDIDDWLDIDGVDLSSAGARLQVSTSNDNVTWGDWSDFVAGEATFRALRARIYGYTTLSHINVVATAAAIAIDMPDRVDHGDDVAGSAGQIDISFGSPFMAMPALAVTGQGMATGDYFQITNKTLAGFSVTFRNAAGTAVSRTFDWLAKGY